MCSVSVAIALGLRQQRGESLGVRRPRMLDGPVGAVGVRRGVALVAPSLAERPDVVGVVTDRVEECGRRLRGLDDVGVVGNSLARLAARDQQQSVHAGQRRAQGLWAGVVRRAHGHAALGEVGGFSRGCARRGGPRLR